MNDTQQQTLQQFIDKHALKFTAEWVSRRPDGLMPESASHYKCKISASRLTTIGKASKVTRKAMTVYFSMGAAHTGEPTLAQVLECLASDASTYENANGFEEWARDLGYDEDSRKAEGIWKAVQRGSKRLQDVLGNVAYQELLWNTERE